MAQQPQKTGNQFAHIDTYARKPKPGAEGAKWSALDVLSEAMRLPGHCDHVASPQPPEVVAGLHPGRLAERLDALIDQRRVEGRRRPRGDVHVLACAVYSWPEHTDYADQERLRAWIADTIAWHERAVGPVDSAVLHLDESFPHIHVYSVSADARGLTPGWQAKREAAEAGASARDQGVAYREAMSGWQDRYHAEVGAFHGLERLGPARQRLKRGEWRAAKPARLAAADANRAARDAALAAEQAAAQARQEAQLAAQQADKARVELELAEISRRVASQRVSQLVAQAAALETDLRELPKLRTQAAQNARRLELIEVGLELAELVDSSLKAELIDACKAMIAGSAAEDARLRQLFGRANKQLQPTEPGDPSPDGPGF